jgi:hypothetical protein
MNPERERLVAEVQSELHLEEPIIWIAKAKESYAAFALYLFALPWTGVSLYLEVVVVTGLFGRAECPISAFPALILGVVGIPFLFVGCIMLVAPFLHVRKLRGTVSVVTDRRALTVSQGRRREVVSIPLSSVTRTHLRERRDGSGDLILRLTSEPGSDDTVEHGFEGVLDVRGAKRAVEDALASMGVKQVPST